MRPVVGIMVAMMVIMFGMRRAATPGAHGCEALLTKLPAFRQHARFNPVRVRNEFGAQPHRIRRAGLAYIDALGSGSIESPQKGTDRQS
jgi:hypothetical protein